MISEGKGRHAPQPIVQPLDRHALWLCFNAAANISRGRGYANSTNEWKKGLTSGLLVPNIGWLPGDSAPRFIGNAGEAGVIRFLNDRLHAALSLDDRFLTDGDGGTDLELCGLTSQIKTRQSNKSHARDRVSLVRYATNGGTVVFPATTTLVCCELRLPAFDVALLGWIYTARAKELPQSPARRGNHINIEIPDCELQPMASLVDLLAARRELVT